MICEPLPGPGSPTDPGSLADPGPLAYTGFAGLGLLLTVAVVCLIAGGVLLLLSRRRGKAVTVVLLVLLSSAAMSITSRTPAQAQAPYCPPAENWLTITQTSVMLGLAPGAAPVPIAGIVANNGTDSTDIVAIDVEITGVTTDVGPAPGICDPSDYFLVDSRMPVGVTLAPGGSTVFGGASIGFSNKSTNQDTCKGATIHLLYTANPT